VIRALLLVAPAVAISAPALARCYRCEHRGSKAKHKFEVETGYPYGRPGYVIDHVVRLACGGADN
jgi:hypothetical protein